MKWGALTRRGVLLAAGALAVLAAIVIAVVVSTSAVTHDNGRSGPDLTPTPSPTSPNSPSGSSTSRPDDDGTDAQSPGAVDPYYGDVVVATPTGSEPGRFENGLVVELVSVRRETVTGSGVGSTSGEAIVVELRLTNTGAASASVAGTVTAYAGDERTPLTPVDAGASDQPFESSLGATESDIGTFWFMLDPADAPLRFAISVDSESGLVVLEYR
jgi:hypothetical protein